VGTLPPTISSQVSGIGTEALQFDLQLTLVPPAVLEKYKAGCTRLKELEAIGLDDQLWALRSFNNNDVGVVKLLCVEC
jgi:hypothetical protein